MIKSSKCLRLVSGQSIVSCTESQIPLIFVRPFQYHTLHQFKAIIAPALIVAYAILGRDPNVLYRSCQWVI